MSSVHLAAMLVAAAGLVVVIGTGGWSVARHRDPQPGLDRALLGVGAGAVVAIATGGLLLASGARPADPLHLVYAVVILAVPFGARYVMRPARSPRAAGGLALAAIIGLAVIVRLVQTG